MGIGCKSEACGREGKNGSATSGNGCKRAERKALIVRAGAEAGRRRHNLDKRDGTVSV